MLAGDFEPTEQQREDADINAHPSCEVCRGAGCIEKDCPVYGCCGLDKLVETPDGCVHAGPCAAKWAELGAEVSP